MCSEGEQEQVADLFIYFVFSRQGLIQSSWAFDSWSSCLHLPSVKIIGTFHCTRLTDGFKETDFHAFNAHFLSSFLYVFTCVWIPVCSTRIRVCACIHVHVYVMQGIWTPNLARLNSSPFLILARQTVPTEPSLQSVFGFLQNRGTIKLSTDGSLQIILDDRRLCFSAHSTNLIQRVEWYHYNKTHFIPFIYLWEQTFSMPIPRKMKTRNNIFIESCLILAKRVPFPLLIKNLIMYARLAWNLRPSCLSSPDAGILGMHYHAQL